MGKELTGYNPTYNQGLSWGVANSSAWLGDLGKPGRSDVLNFTSSTSDLLDAYADKDKAYSNLMTTGNASNPGGKPESSWLGDLLGGNGSEAQKGAYSVGHLGLGVGQLGLGLASYLQQSDFMKKQGRLLDQQLASNQYEIDRRQGFDKRLADPNGVFATNYKAARDATRQA